MKLPLLATLFVGMSMALAGPAFAGNLLLWADSEIVFPFYPDARGGGTAAMGKGAFDLVPGDGPAGFSAARLTSTEAPVQGAWWFPSHRPMSEPQAMLGNPQARIVMQVRSDRAVSSDVSIAWRVNGEQADAVKTGPINFPANKTIDVALAIPPLATDAKITGLIISFSKAGAYDIQKLALARKAAIDVDPIPAHVLRQSKSQTITGRTIDGVSRVTLRFKPTEGGADAVEKTVPVTGDSFRYSVTAREIPPGYAYQVTAEPAGQPDQVSPARRLFVYPELTGKNNPRVTRDGAQLVADGKPFGFLGVNYTRFNLGLGVEADYEAIAHDVMQMKRWGVRVVRTTVDIGLTQPEPGIYLEDPRYAQIIKDHKLDPRYWDQFDYYVQLAGEQGIYIVLDWHGMPLDPYRYFLGGKPSERNSGKPGTAIAYLAESPTKAGDFNMENPLHLKTLLDSHRWLANHFKGNPNILAIEIPFNEPHTKYMAVEANWRRVVDQCAKAVGDGDPERLTFALGPSYSHNNVLPSVTWLPPDRATGMAPHFYQANGPVPVRPDAKSFPSPWLARDQEATFGWSFPAVTMPLSAVDYPFYNGESGEYGHRILLPNNPEAARILVESQLFQEYAAGMSGRLEWTLWGNETDFQPYVEIYETQFNRFAPVYNSGPLDRQRAEVAFVQSDTAVPASNGHNFGCVPFAKAALDVHLSPLHYLTDSHFRYLAAAELSVGLEQVVESSEKMKYKAYVVDRRNLDPRVEAALKTLQARVLWLDKADDLTAEALADFLKKMDVAVDTKTPREIQLVEGPKYLVAYKRLASDSNAVRIYPILHRTGDVELFNEAGQSVFKGSVTELAEKGIEITLPQWRSAIYRVESGQ